MEPAAVPLGEHHEDIVTTKSREVGAALLWRVFNVHVAEAMLPESPPKGEPIDVIGGTRSEIAST